MEVTKVNEIGKAVIKEHEQKKVDDKAGFQLWWNREHQ